MSEKREMEEEDRDDKIYMSGNTNSLKIGICKQIGLLVPKYPAIGLINIHKPKINL